MEQPFQPDESMGHLFSEQPQSFGQPVSYASQQQTAWPYSHASYMQTTQPNHMPNFSRAFDASQAAGYFPQYCSATPDPDQSFAMAHSLTLDNSTTPFTMDLSPHAPFHFTNTSVQPYSQTILATLSPPKDTDMPDSEPASQNEWYRQFGTDRQSTIEATLDGFTTTQHASIDTNAMVDNYLSPPASRNSPSRSLESPHLASSSSPMPTQESFIRNSISTESTQTPQQSKAHVCLWRVASGDVVCGKQFTSNIDLHKHMADTHVGVLEATLEHGFVCQWKGCDRLTNKKSESKRGFETKSKIRRHIEIHTGPCEYPYCRT